jgi:hypothetical protein
MYQSADSIRVLTEMDRPRRRLSELSSKELSQRAIEYRRMALTAHSEATIKSLNMLAARYAILAAKREVEASRNHSAEPLQSEVRRLRALAEQAAANMPDPIRALADTIRLMAASEADPYLTMGVLVEGAIYILRTSIPLERQTDAGTALVRMLIDRLRDNEGPMMNDL